MRVVLDHVDDVAQNIKTFWFKPERQIHHIAGQFIELRIPHEDKDKRGDKRWFTLSSSPTEELVSITTKFTPEGGSSFKQALLNLDSKSSVTMTDPMGDFVLPKDESTELVFVAGGIGVTPIRSMIKSLQDISQKRPITLIYAANKTKELAFTDLFKSAAIRFIPVIGQPTAGWHGETGRLDAKRIFALAGGHENKYIFLSGPEPLVESVAKDLKQLGVNKQSLVVDYFPGYTEL